MKAYLMILAALVAFVCGGCQATPGVNQLEYTKTFENGQPVIKVGFMGSKDTGITAGPQNQPGLSVDLEKGTITIQNMTSNGSNLAGINAPVLIQQSNNVTAIVQAVIGLVQSGAITIPGLGGGGSVVLPGGTATSPAADDATVKALRDQLLARVAACPFMSDSQKADLSTLVQNAPADYLAKYVAGFVTVQTTAKAAK